MTLNFTPCSIFPVSPTEVPIALADANSEGFGKAKSFNWEIGDSYDICGDRRDRGGSCEAVDDDNVLDLLPSDPFDMDMDPSTAFTMIGDWLEDIEIDEEDLESGSGEIEMIKGDYELVAGLNFLWNTAMRGFQSELENVTVNYRESMKDRFDSRVDEKDLGACERSYDHGSISIRDGEEFLSLHDSDFQECELDTQWNASWGSQPASIIYEQDDDEFYQAFDFESADSGDEMQVCSSGGGGAPHEALTFALGYLGVQDLLSAERVCRSLHSVIRNDVLLWWSIHIDWPLSERLNDDALLRLTARAHGNLRCLSLVECPWITDDGLKCVLENNPRLTKLSVPGCTRLSAEGIISNLKAFNSLGGACGIKILRIGALFGVTHKHLEEMKLLLGADKSQPEARKPQFYHISYSSPPYDDDRAIDIEICPRCQNPRLVYDCPRESCKGRQSAAQRCRACTFCIERCIRCGRCVDDGEYMETFCLDLLCSNCWQQVVPCQDIREENGVCSKHAIFQQETRYCFHLYC